MGPFNEVSLDSITRGDFWRFQSRLDNLADEPSIPLPQDDAKNLQVMCVVQDDIEKQRQFATALAGLASYSDEKEKAAALDKIIVGLAAGTEEDALSICGISVTSTQNKDKIPMPPATTLIAPPKNLWRGIMNEFDDPGTTAQTIRICSFHDRWFNGVQAMLPIQVQSLIEDTWSQNSGWLASELEQEQFNTMLDLCKESFSITYDPSADQYITYHNPEAYCTKALELAARGDSALVKEEMQGLFANNLLNINWTSWAARQSFCSPTAEHGPWARLKVMATIYTSGIIAGVLVAVPALAGMSRLAVKIFFIEFAARLTFTKLFKIFINPIKWPTAIRNAWTHLKNKWRGPKGGGGAKPAANAGDETAAKPVGDAAPKEAKDAAEKSPTPVDSNFSPVPIPIFFEWAPRVAAFSAAEALGSAAGLMTPVPPSVIDESAKRFSNPRYKVSDSL